MTGRTWKYGDNVDTDVIIPARYLNTSEPSELAKYCMEDIDKDFAKEVQPGDIIVAGENLVAGHQENTLQLPLRQLVNIVSQKHLQEFSLETQSNRACNLNERQIT